MQVDGALEVELDAAVGVGFAGGDGEVVGPEVGVGAEAGGERSVVEGG